MQVECGCGTCKGSSYYRQEAGEHHLDLVWFTVEKTFQLQVVEHTEIPALKIRYLQVQEFILTVKKKKKRREEEEEEEGENEKMRRRRKTRRTALLEPFTNDKWNRLLGKRVSHCRLNTVYWYWVQAGHCLKKWSCGEWGQPNYWSKANTSQGSNKSKWECFDKWFQQRWRGPTRPQEELFKSLWPRTAPETRWGLNGS